MRERVFCVRRGEPGYPERLSDLPDPPDQLWAIGDIALLDLPTAAVVGTRRSTTHGERLTRELVSALVRAGAVVISGMARGIDGVAHRAAMDAGGKTIAVLATGVDIAYPPSHRSLHRRIADEGLLLAEYPPGAHSHKGAFLERNRLIAALARVTIVTEAPIKSGALRTAEAAMEINRQAAALPGPIDIPQSAGCNNLIGTGAHIITCIADALTLMRLTPRIHHPSEHANADEASVWEALRSGAADLDTLCAQSGLPVQRCLAAVTALELRGEIECELTGEIRRR